MEFKTNDYLITDENGEEVLVEIEKTEKRADVGRLKAFAEKIAEQESENEE